ncbi:MAG: ribosome-associated translation inhibitor RaiA [Planctomycetota bacterium]
MSVLVTVRDKDVPNDLKEYTREKGERLHRFFNGITKLEIILMNEGLKKRAEAVLHIAKGDPIVVHADHEQMAAAVDLMLDRAQQSLVKHKEKLRNHRGAGGEVPPQAGEPEEQLESYDEIIEKTEFPGE